MKFLFGEKIGTDILKRVPKEGLIVLQNNFFKKSMLLYILCSNVLILLRLKIVKNMVNSLSF